MPRDQDKSLSHVALGMQGKCIVQRKAVCAIAIAVAGLDRDHVMLTPTIRGYGVYVPRTVLTCKTGWIQYDLS
jgi:hypothetical protein